MNPLPAVIAAFSPSFILLPLPLGCSDVLFKMSTLTDNQAPWHKASSLNAVSF
ncbi:hypothetical protein EXN66_Car010805 [Channa argus]|uniref:Uncharacterized protein n=1 Tax=Channa argus TaxID=215402 RepID=A0A6G1PY30_CHAAH|nr:hypothetical protein EXN66_Car010805 [Channa argus]